MADWSGFFQAELGASAALVGLVIVAISINLVRILADPTLPGRAAEMLVAPTGVVAASSFALVPGQPARILGAELLVIGAAMALASLRILVPVLGGAAKIAKGYVVGRAIFATVCVLPFIVSGALLVAAAPGALYWIVPGIIVSLVSTVLNAWVLLIEILR
ncbi:MAG TPA: hypothetical protein VNU97_18265 [Rhizomicrobium sp.]|jgi:hypothetical protein|nr:hypothetical protein [Rhizomicrobium sp.]